jgi:ArsR family transcriptional regulator
MLVTSFQLIWTAVQENSCIPVVRNKPQDAALAQDTRLYIFRLLVPNAKGTPGGSNRQPLSSAKSDALVSPQRLAAADVIDPHKNGRSISYSAKLEAVNRLTEFLMENCCGGEGLSYWHCNGRGRLLTFL